MSAIPYPESFPAGESAPVGAISRRASARSVLNYGVLVLNRHWTAVHVCTVRRALSLVVEDLARIVTEDYQSYDFDSWRELSHMNPGEGPWVHTPHYAIRAPQVIVLAHYNRIPPRRVRFNRRNIFLRDNFTCQYCGCRPPRDELTIDHILPRSRGGLSNWENVVLACARCNSRKGNRLPHEVNMGLLRKPKKPHWLSCVNFTPGEEGRTLWQQFVDTAYWNTSLFE